MDHRLRLTRLRDFCLSWGDLIRARGRPYTALDADLFSLLTDTAWELDEALGEMPHLVELDITADYT